MNPIPHSIRQPAMTSPSRRRQVGLELSAHQAGRLAQITRLHADGLDQKADREADRIIREHLRANACEARSIACNLEALAWGASR